MVVVVGLVRKKQGSWSSEIQSQKLKSKKEFTVGYNHSCNLLSLWLQRITNCKPFCHFKMT